MSEALEGKTLTELRAMLQALGTKLDWGWDKQQLIRRITNRMQPRTVAPSISDKPSDQRLRLVPPAKNLTQMEISRELEPLRLQGLVITFPSPDTVQFTMQGHNGPRIDSCSLRVPLRVVLQAAKAVLNG